MKVNRIEREKVEVVGARVLVEPVEATTETESGLAVSQDNNTSKGPVLGTVISVGSESKFQKGDVIFFRRYSIDSLKVFTEIGEQKVDLVDDEDILAIIKN